MDADVATVAAFLQQPTWSKDVEERRGPNSRTLVTVSALDAAGDVVVEDEFELLVDEEAHQTSSIVHRDLPFLRHFVIRTTQGKHDDYFSEMPLHQFVAQRKRDGFRNLTTNLYIAPYFFTMKGYGFDDDMDLTYKPAERVSRRIKASLDELRRVQELKCKVTYRP